MPRILNVHVMLEETWPWFCTVETQIYGALECAHRDLLPNLEGCSAMHGRIDSETIIVIHDEVSVVVSPVMMFHTKQQLEAYLGDSAKMLLEQLKQVKPKAIGNLWVACSVNPGRMCYELVLAVPFSKEE